MQAQYIITGLLVGTLVGLTGMGGGSLMTPILVLVLGFRPAVAVGTDLTYAAVTKAVGAIQHFRQGQVRISTGLLYAAGSVPATLAGVGLIHALEHTHGVNVDRLIGHALAYTLLVVAVLMFIQPVLRKRLWPAERPSVFYRRLRKMRRWRPPMLIAIGVVVGFLVGVTSVGAGSLVMFSMLLLFPKWPMSQRVGTDVFQGFMVSAAAASANLHFGTVNLPVVGQLLIGSLPGVLIGARLTKSVPEGVLRPLVAGALAISGLRLL
ncbi:MAG: sulfite exporter TauE/SafE family protein [Ktedonobacterales bacterium]